MGKRFKTYGDVLAYLDAIPKFSQKGADAAHFALDHMELFTEKMGNPQDRLKTIHVAGTNGKGTTCQMLASVYQQAGYKTGLYTSPHLVRFNERVRVNGEDIPDHEILTFFQCHEQLLDDIPLTYFEISTCLAFWYLEKQQCEICLIETGLGGRLDATNVIKPLACVITSISKDHTEILGNSIPDIAKEKAGIIKDNRPVICGDLPESAKIMIEEIAANRNAPVTNAMQFHPGYRNREFVLHLPDGARIGINGEGRKRIDRFNIAISYGTIQSLEALLPVSNEEFIIGIESLETRFSGHAHFEKLLPDREWYFDGAHNPAAVKTLVEEIELLSDEREPFIFLSLMKDKAIPELLENFLHYKNVYYIETGSERCAGRNQILSILPDARVFHANQPDLRQILDRLKSKLVIFTGSFYFYSEVKKWMASLQSSDQAKSPGFVNNSP